MLFKELREKLETQPIAFKKYEVDGTRIVMFKEDDSYTIMIDDTMLDEKFDDALKAEDAIKEFLQLLGNE
jgi:hypothetical protein